MPVRHPPGIQRARIALVAMRALRVGVSFLFAPAVCALFLFTPGAVRAQQVVLSNSQGLDFGRFVAAGGGSVTIAPGGVRSRAGSVVLLNSPNARQALFRVSRNGGGTTNKAVIISLPANGATRLANGGNSMAVNNFVSSPASIATIPAGGVTLAVGATLTVAPNQPRGNYSGSFSLIVNYQ